MDLFDEDPGEAASPAPAPPSPFRKPRAPAEIASAQPDPAALDLAAQLPAGLRMGTSSWTFPGWNGLVWDGEYPETQLSRKGLAAYGRHPLLRSVSLDRAFYRPLTASQYAAYAAQVPDDFRFVVKAPSLVTDALLRAEDGRGMQPNPSFLDAALAASSFVEPVFEGLGAKVGALVFQISPLPASCLARMPELLDRLAAMLAALPARPPQAPHAVFAVEVRDPEFITQDFARVLKAAGAAYCLGLHAKMPPIEDQLPMLRALWPSPLVCRWNLHRKHGAYGYQEAKDLYEPFDKLADPDPETRTVLAKVAHAAVSRGLDAYITINNKAEGSAPLSVLELARAVRDLSGPPD